MKVNFILTEAGISMVLGGKTRTVAKGESCYEAVKQAILQGASEEEVLTILNRDLDRISDAVQALHEKRITDDVTISGGQVFFRGAPVHPTLTARMLQLLEEGFDLKPMARFLENLMQNPSYRAIRCLYSFLEFGKMPITEDGCFLAYKAVRPDYKDIWSGTIDNSIGCVVEMPRNAVDEDPTRTCSYGLHVCSFDYLPRFAHANGHVMICKVNPRDVVAIPVDYNNTKMRVCRYEVVGEYEGYYTEHRHILGNTAVATAEAPFEVVYEGNGDFPPERFELLSDAASHAEEALKNPRIERVTIKNVCTGIVLHEYENPYFEGYDTDDEDDPDEARYEIVYAETADMIADGNYAVHESKFDDLDAAKDEAFALHKRLRGIVIQVRDRDTGAVELTLS